MLSRAASAASSTGNVPALEHGLADYAVERFALTHRH